MDRAYWGEFRAHRLPLAAATMGLGFGVGLNADTAGLFAAGARLLRFWLTATRLGLAVQPGFAMMIFAHYGAADVPFTADPALRKAAALSAERLRRLVGQDADRLVFLCRVGEPRGRQPQQRSVRRPVAELLEGWDDRAADGVVRD